LIWTCALVPDQAVRACALVAVADEANALQFCSGLEGVEVARLVLHLLAAFHVGANVIVHRLAGQDFASQLV
jgi:hypothetical protein